MFAATPRLRDLLDARTVALVAVLALAAFGLQLAFLAGTVASPLGGAIADFQRPARIEGAPHEAIARAHEPAKPAHAAGRAAPLPWEQRAPLAVDDRPIPLACLVEP